MKKTLVSLLSGFFLLGNSLIGTSALVEKPVLPVQPAFPIQEKENSLEQVFPKGFEKFKNYRERAIFSKSEIKYKIDVIQEIPSFLVFYDLPGERVEEFYIFNFYINERGVSVSLEEHPYLYFFDLNGDNTFTQDEMFLDTSRDGLNGNENTIQSE